MNLADDDSRHGTWNGYNNYRCRCEPCRAAAADYHKTHDGTPKLRAKYRAQGLTTRGRPYKSDWWEQKVWES